MWPHGAQQRRQGKHPSAIFPMFLFMCVCMLCHILPCCACPQQCIVLWFLAAASASGNGVCKILWECPSLQQSFLLPLILGIPVVSFGEVSVTSELNADPLTFNVTCTSVDGPITSVAWTVDGSPVPSENNPITTRTVDDTETGAYTLTLSVTGILTGTYNCTVTSVRPEGISKFPGMYVTSANMTISGEYNN